MYLPTGTPHAARAQDTVSLHITIGINQLTWRGLVERSLSSLAAEVPSDHLPAGYLEDPQALAHQLGRHLSDIADRLHSVDPTDVIDAEVRRFLTSRPPRLEGALVDGLPLDAIDDDTLLRRRPGPPLRAGRARATGSRCSSATGPSTYRPGSGRPSRRSAAAPSCAPATCPSTSRAVWCWPGAWSGRGCSGSSPNDVHCDERVTFRCAVASEARAESMAGTASTVRSFLLVEHSGPWGEEALRDARMPEGIGPELRERAAATRTKVLLIRRPEQGGAHPCGSPGLRGRTPTTPSPGSRPPSSTTCTASTTSTSRRWPRAGRSG